MRLFQGCNSHLLSQDRHLLAYDGHRLTFQGVIGGPFRTLACQPADVSQGRTNSADASAHETDDVGGSCSGVFRFSVFSQQRGSRDGPKRADASADGSRVDALQKPRLIDSDGTCLGHTRCHRAVRTRLRPNSSQHVVNSVPYGKLAIWTLRRGCTERCLGPSVTRCSAR